MGYLCFILKISLFLRDHGECMSQQQDKIYLYAQPKRTLHFNFLPPSWEREKLIAWGSRTERMAYI